MAADRAPALTPQDYAQFGRWLAELMADAWRNGLRTRPSDAQAAGGRASSTPDAQPPTAQDEPRGTTTELSVTVPD